MGITSMGLRTKVLIDDTWSIYNIINISTITLNNITTIPSILLTYNNSKQWINKLINYYRSSEILIVIQNTISTININNKDYYHTITTIMISNTLILIYYLYQEILIFSMYGNTLTSYQWSILITLNINNIELLMISINTICYINSCWLHNTSLWWIWSSNLCISTIDDYNNYGTNIGFLTTNIYEYHTTNLWICLTNYCSIWYLLITLHLIHVSYGTQYGFLWLYTLFIWWYLTMFYRYWYVVVMTFNYYKLHQMYWHYVDNIWILIVMTSNI